MGSDEPDVRSPTALAYEMTEEAKVLLAAAGLRPARTAAGEAAYYLSDALEPDVRCSLLELAERRRPDDDGDSAARSALDLLVQIADDVEDMLTGPGASAELHIALRALRRAIGATAQHLGLAGQIAGQATGSSGLRARHR